MPLNTKWLFSELQIQDTSMVKQKGNMLLRISWLCVLCIAITGMSCNYEQINSETCQGLSQTNGMKGGQEPASFATARDAEADEDLLEAIELHRLRNYQEARNIVCGVLSRYPEDKAARALLSLIDQEVELMRPRVRKY